MDYELYYEVALTKNISKSKFKKGDLATIIEMEGEGKNKLYTLEFYSPLGDSIGVFKVTEDYIQHLQSNAVVHMREIS